MPEVAQVEFPEYFVVYARQKLEKDRLVVEYLSQFGDQAYKIMAQTILDAAGEGVRNGK